MKTHSKLFRILGTSILILLILGSCEEVALHDHLREMIQLEPVVIAHDADAAGFSDTNITVSLTSSKVDADIRYTTNQEEPTEDSDRYRGPVVLSGHNSYVTLKARAFHDEHYPSPIVSQDFHIVYSTVANPVLSPAPGELNADTAIAIISPTAGATIRYTSDGTAPNANSPVYSGPISVSGQGTTVNIKAFAAYTGLPTSGTTEGTYTINYPKLTKPVFSPLPGTYASNQNVTITSEAGSTVYYTTDSSDPRSSATRKIYSGPIAVSGLGTSRNIWAYAVRSQHRDSDSILGNYSIQADKSLNPVFSVASGTLSSNTSITISAGSGATVYYTYTEDGSAPPMPLINENGSPYRGEVYSGPIPLEGDGSRLRISAVAKSPSLTQSDSVMGDWRVDWPVAQAPSITPDGGAFNTDQSISLHSPDGGTIYYTTNGAAPSDSSSVYSTPFGLSTAVDSEQDYPVQAYVVADQMKPSAVTSRTIRIDKLAPAVPSLNAIGAYAPYTNDATPIFSWTATGDSHQIRLDSGSWIDVAGTAYTPASAFSEGTHSADVRAVDLAGNVSATTAISIVVDTIAPAVSAVSPGTKSLGVPTDSSGVTYSVSVSDANIDDSDISAWIIDSGGTVSSGQSVSSATATITGVAPLTLNEEHFIKVTATDRAGNSLTNYTAGRFVTGALFWSDGHTIKKGRLSNLDDPDYPVTTWYTAASSSVQIPDIEYANGKFVWIQNQTAGGLTLSDSPWKNTSTAVGNITSYPDDFLRDIEFDPATENIYCTIPDGFGNITIQVMPYSNVGNKTSIQNNTNAPNPNGLDFAGGYYYWGFADSRVTRSDGANIGPATMTTPSRFNGFAYYNNRVYFVANRDPGAIPNETPEDYVSFIAVWTTNAAFDSYASSWYTFDTGFNSATLADYDGDIEILPTGPYAGIYALIPESNGANEGLSLVRFSSFTTPDMLSASRLRSINVTGQHASAGKVAGLAIVD